MAHMWSHDSEWPSPNDPEGNTTFTDILLAFIVVVCILGYALLT